MVCPLWKTIWWFLKTLNIKLSEGQQFTLRPIHRRTENKDSDTYMPMFTAALFPTAKEPKCPSRNEWKNKVWYIQHNIIQPQKRMKF